MTVKKVKAKRDVLGRTVNNQLLQTGDYTIYRFQENDFWIHHISGEGMQVRAGDFYKLIDDYFKKEF